MAISPILLNGTIQQTHDVLSNQTKEVQKGALDQGNIYQREVKQGQEKARQVVQSDETRFQEERFDAKEKGKGAYHGKKGSRKKQDKGDGKVVVKPEGGFDIKI